MPKMTSLMYNADNQVIKDLIKWFKGMNYHVNADMSGGFVAVYSNDRESKQDEVCICIEAAPSCWTIRAIDKLLTPTGI